MSRLGAAAACDFGTLIDYMEPPCSGLPATVVALVEFGDGTREEFRLCERCAQHLEATRDPRTPRIVTVRREASHGS